MEECAQMQLMISLVHVLQPLQEKCVNMVSGPIVLISETQMLVIQVKRRLLNYGVLFRG